MGGNFQESVLLLIEDEGEVGSCMKINEDKPNKGEIQINYLATSPLHQGRGLMKRVFNALDLAYPVWKQILHVRGNNEGAIGLYKKMGFKQENWDGRTYRNGDKMLLF